MLEGKSESAPAPNLWAVMGLGAWEPGATASQQDNNDNNSNINNKHHNRYHNRIQLAPKP